MIIKYVFKNKGQNNLMCYLNNALHLCFLMLGGDDFLKLFSEALRVLYNPTPRLCFLLSFVLDVLFGLRSWIFKPVLLLPAIWINSYFYEAVMNINLCLPPKTYGPEMREVEEKEGRERPDEGGGARELREEERLGGNERETVQRRKGIKLSLCPFTQGICSRLQQKSFIRITT